METVKAKATWKENITQQLSIRIKNSWQLYVMLLLPVAYIIIFNYIPMYGAQIAFRRYDGSQSILESPWVGMYYFKKFFDSYQFERVLTNTLMISLYSLVAGFPLPIIFALALNVTRSAKYRKVVQMVTYMPHFISTVVLVGIVMQVFNTRIGLYGKLMEAMGMTAVNLLGSPAAFPHLYVLSGIWQSVGWSTIIYLAALSNVDQEQHEAAIVDGASRFKRVIYVDIPAIMPTAIILLIMNAGQLMSVGFEKAYIMQNSLNISASELISTYVYKIGLTNGGGDFSYGAAIGLFNSVVNLVLLLIVNAISKKVSDTSLW